MRIAIISSWLPRECGIATFSRDVANSLKEFDKEIDISVCALQESGGENRKYGPEVKWLIREAIKRDYIKAAEDINKSDVDIVFLSHEFGLFGPEDGKNILLFLENIKKPLVSNFHTIPLLPKTRRRKTRLDILKKISEKSRFVIITSQNAKEELVKKFGFKRNKLKVIYHGTPEIPFLSKKEKEEMKKDFGFKENGIVILSPGMIRKSKGLEYAVKAMEKISKNHPEVIFVITGEAHPSKISNWQYYQYLKKLTEERKLNEHIKFIDHYLTDEEMKNYFAVSDIILLPYLAKEQVSSGILAWALAAGKIIVSTPFYYAKEVLKNRGFFINYRDVSSIENKIKNILKNQQKSLLMAKKARNFGLGTHWKKTAKKYWDVFEKVKNSSEANHL